MNHRRTPYHEAVTVAPKILGVIAHPRTGEAVGLMRPGYTYQMRKYRPGHQGSKAARAPRGQRA